MSLVASSSSSLAHIYLNKEDAMMMRGVSVSNVDAISITGHWQGLYCRALLSTDMGARRDRAFIKPRGVE